MARVWQRGQRRQGFRMLHVSLIGKLFHIAEFSPYYCASYFRLLMY